MSQNGKVILITGASSGFGAITAGMAARQGYRVVVTARREDRLQALVDDITQAGGEALAISGDITDPDIQQQVIGAALARYGRIDVLVNNAGVPLKGGFIDESADELRRQWETNVVSLVTLARLALPELARTKGVIINIGSIAGHFSFPSWGSYYPTKVAVASISHALRRELGPRGVQVCLIEPGLYQTEFGQRAGIATGMGGQPERVARAILRAAARPRPRTVVPFWMGPFVALGGFFVSALPELADLVFWVITKRRMRQEAAQAAKSPELEQPT